MATRWTLRRFSSAKNDFTRSAPAFRHYKLSHPQQVKGCELMGLMKYERDGQVRWRRSATYVCLHRCSCILRRRRSALFCLSSGIMVGLNWLLFIWAVNIGHVLETSPVYLMAPLVV